MSKKIKIIFFLLSFLAIALNYYHTNTLKISYHNLSFSSAKKMIKIAHISDLHSDTIGKLEMDLINILKKENPVSERKSLSL